MVKRLLWLLTLLFLATGTFAEAQQSAKVPRLGYVTGGGDANNPGPNAEAFRRGLLDLGYVEGKNIFVEYRYGEGKQDRIPDLVAELVQLKVDIFISGSLTAIRAAKQTTKTIPIVMVITGDPVASGIVDSLSSQGGIIVWIIYIR